MALNSIKQMKLRLTNQLKNLSPEQIKSLSDTMLNASIAFETGGNYKEIFRRARNRSIGLMKRIYELLLNATQEEIENLSRNLTDGGTAEVQEVEIIQLSISEPPDTNFQ